MSRTEAVLFGHPFHDIRYFLWIARRNSASSHYFRVFKGFEYWSVLLTKERLVLLNGLPELFYHVFLPGNILVEERLCDHNQVLCHKLVEENLKGLQKWFLGDLVNWSNYTS